jgi:hypothetical protein
MTDKPDTFDAVLANMTLMGLDWLSSALFAAAEREDNSYVDPDYTDISVQVIWALDMLGQLVDEAYMIRVKEEG